MVNNAKIQDVLNQIRGDRETASLSSFSQPQQLNPLTGLPMASNTSQNVIDQNEALASLQSGNENLIERLNFAGIDTGEAEDSRNIVEKFFKLPEKQNWIFDIFELIQRPQKAIFGAIQEATDPLQNDYDRDPMGEFWKGLTGEEKDISGGQIIRNVFKGGEREEGDLDWTDAVGFAMDVILDPADLIGIPLVGKLKVFNKTAKGTKKTLDVAQDSAYAIAKAKGLGDDFVKTATKVVQEQAGIIKASEKLQYASANTIVWKSLGWGLKKGAKMSDDILVKGMTILDPKVAEAYVSMQKKAVRNFSTIGAGLRSKATKWFAKSNRAVEELSYLSKEMDDYMEVAVEHFIPMQTVGEVIGIDDMTALFNDGRKTVNEVTEWMLETRKAKDILFTGTEEKVMAIINDAKPEHMKEALVEAQKVLMSADILNLYEFKYLVNNPMDVNELVNQVATGVRKEMPLKDNTIKALKEAWGDELYNEAVTEVTIGGKRVLEFNQDFFNNGNTRKKLYRTVDQLAENDITKQLKEVLPTMFPSKKKQQVFDDLLNRSKNIKTTRELLKDKDFVGLLNRLGLSDDSVAKVTKKLNKKTSASSSAYGELIDALSDIDELPALKAVKGDTKFLGRRITEGTGGIINNAGTPADDVLRKSTFKLHAGDEARNITELIPGNLIDDFNNITNQGTENLVNGWRHVLNNAPEIQTKMSPRVLGTIQQKMVPDIGAGKWIQPVSESRKITLSSDLFYDDENLAFLKKLQGDADISALTEDYRKYIEIAQRKIGKSVYGDELALIKHGMDGYTPHVSTRSLKRGIQTPEQIKESMAQFVRDLKEKFGYDSQIPDDFFDWSRTRSLQARQYEGSVMEINSMKQAYYREKLLDTDHFKNLPTEQQHEIIGYLAEDMFSTDVRASFGDLIVRKTKDIHYNQRNADILLSMAFGNPTAESNMMRIVPSNTVIPKNFVDLSKSDVNQIIKGLEASGKWMDDDSYHKQLIELLTPMTKADGEKVIMQKELATLALRTVGKDPTEFLDMVTEINNVFKALKVTSPAFNLRNIMGNMYNMWVSGIPATKIPRYWTRAWNNQNQMKEIAEIISTKGPGALNDAQSALYAKFNLFRESGFLNSDNAVALRDLQSLTKSKLGNALNPENAVIPGQAVAKKGLVKKALEKSHFDTLMEYNLRGNLVVDNVSRMALYEYAIDNPDYLLNLGMQVGEEGAMDAVRFALFDPNNLSMFEQETMKKLIPFYTWARQNLAFQAQNLMMNSDKYYKTYKAFESGWGAMGIEIGDLNPYEVSQIYIPLPWRGEDGEYTALKSSLPMADLLEFSNPKEALNRVISSTTPLIRAPFEASTGTQTFTGQPIERYQGEASKNIPFITKKQEWMLGNVGIDVPLKGVSGIASTLTSLAGGDPGKAGEDLLKFINISSPPRLITQNLISKEYDKQEILESLRRKNLAKDVKIPTLAEITSQQQSSVGLKQTKTELDDIQILLDKMKRR